MFKFPVTIFAVKLYTRNDSLKSFFLNILDDFKTNLFKLLNLNYNKAVNIKK